MKQKMNLDKLLERKKDEYIDHLKNLVKIDTRVIGHGIKGGNEINGQKYLKVLIENIGGRPEYSNIKAEKIKEAKCKFNEGNLGHNYYNRPNLLGFFDGYSSGKSLIVNGHIDTMPFGDKKNWHRDPFLGEQINGKIYGLGSSDMKAGLLASLFGIDLIYSAGYNLKGDIIYQSVVDEEGGGNGTLSLVQEGYKADAAIVCEPTSLNLQIAHMGFIFYEIILLGKPIHSSQKWKGINAIHKAYKLINGLMELEHQWLLKYKHPLMPPPTINIGYIKGGDEASTVPASCSFKICVHYFPGIKREKIDSDIRQTLQKLNDLDPWLSENPVEISIYQEGSSFEIDKNHHLVKTFKKYIPNDKEINASPSGNDARIFSNIADIPVVVFGPGSLEKAHSIDEDVSIDDYISSILSYAKFYCDWCGIENEDN